MRHIAVWIFGSLAGWLVAGVLHASPSAPMADLIVVNADIHTADRTRPRAEALAIKDRRFLAVGSLADVLALRGPSTRVVDALGQSVTPGFIDGHSHMGGNSPRVAGVDLSYVVDKADWLTLIAEADRNLPPEQWMTGGYWDHTLSDGQYPDRAMLDRIVPDRPIFLTHIDGHYAWVNTRALALAGITADTPVPPGGEILLDPLEGLPTGMLLEGAMELVRAIIPARDSTQRRADLMQMQAYANSLGITGLHQMGDLHDYLFLTESAAPSLRIWYGQSGSSGSAETFDDRLRAIVEERQEVEQRVARAGRTASLGPLLAVGYVKLINDGVLSARTAVLLEDYADQPGWRGEYITTTDELIDQVEKVNRAGLPVAIHSIGDAAVRAALDAFEAAAAVRPVLPNRIEHIEVVTPADIQRFKTLGVAASMQPNHCTNAIGYVPSRLGVVRAGDAYVWRGMLAAEVPLVFGADYPTSPLSPLVQIADAMFRSSPFGFANGQSWFPKQALSFEEALYAYTQAPADLTAWSTQVGSITPGKWADFVILDGKVPEPMTTEFRRLKVAATYFAGQQVFAGQ